MAEYCYQLLLATTCEQRAKGLMRAKSKGEQRGVSQCSIAFPNVSFNAIIGVNLLVT